MEALRVIKVNKLKQDLENFKVGKYQSLTIKLSFCKL